jgi:formylglycine-generating enzyme required for sulfatase activity
MNTMSQLLRAGLFGVLVMLMSPPLRAEDASVYKSAPTAGTEIVHPVDGAIMVWVPAGQFIMGCDADEAKKIAASLCFEHYHKIAAEEWFPRRRVYVDGFFIDKYEVTNELWNKYTKASGYVTKHAKGPKAAAQGLMEMYPAAQVTWAEAQQYANWARKSLPFERQWEKAARGTDGRWYPWGNEPPTPERGVFPTGKRGEDGTYEMVGTHPKGDSPYGACDMSGNLYEWTSEFMEPRNNNPEAERLFSYTGHQNALLRGGSFYHAMHAVNAIKRFGFKPEETYYHVGFRCVWEPAEDWFTSDAFKDAKAKVAARKAELEKLRSTSTGSTKGWVGGP